MIWSGEYGDMLMGSLCFIHVIVVTICIVVSEHIAVKGPLGGLCTVHLVIVVTYGLNRCEGQLTSHAVVMGHVCIHVNMLINLQYRSESVVT